MSAPSRPRRRATLLTPLPARAAVLTTWRLALAPALAVVVLVCGAATAGVPAPSWMTRACAYEDSVNCFWDAGTRGDGRGQSFFAVRVRGEVCVLYADDRYARRHNRCVPID